MIPLSLKRRHLRAPLRNEIVVISDGGENCLASVGNISEGGVFIQNVDFSLGEKGFSLFFEIPIIPDLTKYSRKEILNLNQDSFEYKVIGAMAESRREVQSVNEINEQVFSVGCEFVDLRSESQEEIKRYVAQYSVNIVYVLSLFEQGTNKEDIRNLIKKCLSLMGYDTTVSLSTLREAFSMIIRV